MKRAPFETARSLVQDWLDQGLGSTWAKRDTSLRADEGLAWGIDLQDESRPVRALRVVLRPDFPASPCELYVDRSHFLKLPHVEMDGHVCLGLTPIPADYDDPVGAVIRTLRAFSDHLLGPASNPQWVEEQFHDERVSYWAQFCASRQKAIDRRPIALRTYADIGELNQWFSGTVAAYVPAGSKHRRFSVQVATATNTDAHELASRHRWADGMLVRGNALFVHLTTDVRWTPATWPKSFQELAALVERATNHDFSLVRWVTKTGWSDVPTPHQRRKKGRRNREPEVPAGQRPLLVVLVQDGAAFGYQLVGSAMSRLQPPSIEPVYVTRVDPNWALARDQNLDALHARRKKRVLLLGCGSLGSPLANALARAGIGHLDLVDAQVMETENTCRHELGLSDVGRGKADELARQLMKKIPGLTASGYLADVATWTTKNCRPGMYDLVVECTAESSVRTFISHMRIGLFGSIPVIHTWTEPLCSAGHVVLTQLDVPWPDDDPADALVNASDLSASDTRVELPACSGGFHPYGVADIQLVAAFAVERVIAIVDEMQLPSTVWSWVRSIAFFESLPKPPSTRSIVPVSTSKSDSATTTRELAKVLGLA